MARARRTSADEKTGKSLNRYRAKRDFAATPEPRGHPRARKKPARGLTYVVHKHVASHAHYDLRLEHDGVLLSWAVPKGPSLNPKDKRLAMRVEPHPLDYADFEGVIPEGYGTGVSMVWDRGTWEPEAATSDIAAALRKGELKFVLHGEKLTGSYVLVRTGGPTATGEREKWLLIKHRDEAARDEDITQTAARSAKTGKSLAEIIKSDPDLWESHLPAAYDPVRMRKVVEKVAALPEEQALAQEATSSRKPAKRVGRKTTARSRGGRGA